MAVPMTTVLSETFGPVAQGNQRVYKTPASTADKPQLVYQRSKAAGANGVAEDYVNLVFQTEDASGAILQSKDIMGFFFKRPTSGIAADKAAIKALFREFIASSEFDAVVDGQSPIV